MVRGRLLPQSISADSEKEYFIISAKINVLSSVDKILVYTFYSSLKMLQLNYKEAFLKMFEDLKLKPIRTSLAQNYLNQGYGNKNAAP